MHILADLHLHSRYSRAVSPQMTLPVMAAVGKQKDIDLLTVSDWTHPLWFQEVKQSLEEIAEGIYSLKSTLSDIVIPTEAGIQIPGSSPRMTDKTEPHFILSTEVSCIYTHKGKGRRIHHLLFAPSLEVVEKINKELFSRGYNLTSDARPILGISSYDLLALMLEIDERCMIIPAHAWTPWFGIYGQRSGYESLSDAFEDLTPYVYGIETGLSSDPEMNWQMEELNQRSILSFSDAHSPAKMGRELTAFTVEALTYENIRQAIMGPAYSLSHIANSTESPSAISHKPSPNRVSYTIEFYPEEGKYHYSGHRNCHVSLTPGEQAKVHNVCPVCGRPLTDGVMRRVEELGLQHISPTTVMKDGIRWYEDPSRRHPPFIKLVPLLEIISGAIGSPVLSKKTGAIFDTLIHRFGSEIHVLMHAALADLTLFAPEKVVDGIDRVRKGELTITPGFDGVYGTVAIWPIESLTQDTSQLSLLEE